MGLAYLGSGAYQDYPAVFYYALTQSGELWKFTIYNSAGSGGSNSLYKEDLGNIGMQFPGVTTVTGGQSLSMLYDAATGYLLLSSYQTGNYGELFAVNPADLQVSRIGHFGKENYPAVSLYQYERITDLTLLLDYTAAHLYAEETLQLHGRIKPYTYRQEITWSSSDPSVATVDQTGLVTAISGGTAIITATSVDADETGYHASAHCTVSVDDLVPLRTQVQAQITTSDEVSQWVSLDTASMAVTVNATADRRLSGRRRPQWQALWYGWRLCGQRTHL